MVKKWGTNSLLKISTKKIQKIFFEKKIKFFFLIHFSEKGSDLTNLFEKLKK